jgi:hypothetical protein
LLTRTQQRHGWVLWFFLLVLILGLVFGWHAAAVLLVLWLIGYRRALAVHAVQAGKRELLNVQRWFGIVYLLREGASFLGEPMLGIDIKLLPGDLMRARAVRRAHSADESRMIPRGPKLLLPLGGYSRKRLLTAALFCR